MEAVAKLETLTRDRTSLAGSDVSDADKLMTAALSSKESGDIGASRTSLQKALDKLAFLEQDHTEHMERPRIRVATPSIMRRVGENVTLTIAHPDRAWTPASEFQWTRKGADSLARDLKSGNGLQYITSRFWRESSYTIEVRVNGNNALVEPCRIDITPSSTASSRGLIRLFDLGILGLSVLTASGLAFLAIARADSFGDVADYVLAFAGGFGVTEAIKGVGPILARIQGQNV